MSAAVSYRNVKFFIIYFSKIQINFWSNWFIFYATGLMCNAEILDGNSELLCLYVYIYFFLLTSLFHYFSYYLTYYLTFLLFLRSLLR